MKNLKKVILFPTINFAYLIFTIFFAFIVYEYVYDISTNFSRFIAMHSSIQSFYDFLLLLVWVILSVLVFKYDQKILQSKSFS